MDGNVFCSVSMLLKFVLREWWSEVQRDWKKEIKGVKYLLASAQAYFGLEAPDILQGEEIKSQLYFLLLHLSSSALATSPLVIYLLQHGFSAY